MLRRVVITGLGVLAPNGKGKEEFWQATIAGRTVLLREHAEGRARRDGERIRHLVVAKRGAEALQVVPHRSVTAQMPPIRAVPTVSHMT